MHIIHTYIYSYIHTHATDFTMQRRRAESFSLLSPPSVLLILIFISSIAFAMAEGPSEASVHIVYTEKPPIDDVESHHLRTLAAVLGRSSLPFPSSFLHRIDADAVPRGGCFSGSRIIVDPLQFLMKFYSFGNLFINQAKMKAGIENWSSQNFRPGAGHDQKIRRF